MSESNNLGVGEHMKKTVAMKWIKALRSGRYKQAKRFLRVKEAKQDGYCCLGVLCNLSKLGRWKKTKYLGELRMSYLEMTGVLPEEVQKWAGMKSEIGTYFVGNTKKCLSGINDFGASFEEIADFIEKHYKNL
jgi:hypothetical protein